MELTLKPEQCARKGSLTVQRQKKTFSPYKLFMSILRYKLFMSIVQSEVYVMMDEIPPHIITMMEDLTLDDINRRALLLVWETKDICELRRGMERRLNKYCQLRKFSLLSKDLWCSLSPIKRHWYKMALDLASVHPIRYKWRDGVCIDRASAYVTTQIS